MKPFKNNVPKSCKENADMLGLESLTLKKKVDLILGRWRGTTKNPEVEENDAFGDRKATLIFVLPA